MATKRTRTDGGKQVQACDFCFQFASDFPSRCIELTPRSCVFRTAGLYSFADSHGSNVGIYYEEVCAPCGPGVCRNAMLRLFLSEGSYGLQYSATVPAGQVLY